MSSPWASWAGVSASLSPRKWIRGRGPAMGLQSVLLAAVLLLLPGATAQDDSTDPVFLYPPDGSSNIYNKMDTVMVTYQSSYEAGDLWTFCQPGVGKMIYRQKAPGFTATVPILLNFTSDTPCWFNLRPADELSPSGANSAAFNLIGAEREHGPQVFGLNVAAASSSTSSTASSSTSSSSVTSSSSSSSTTSGSAGALTTDVNESPSPTPVDNTSSAEGDGDSGGLSAGAAAGIGIGAAVGVIAVAGGAFMLWRRRRRRGPRGNLRAELAGNMEGIDQSQYGAYGGPPSYGASSVGSPGTVPQKLHAVSSPVEIATSGPFAGTTGRTHHEMAA